MRSDTRSTRAGPYDSGSLTPYNRRTNEEHTMVTLYENRDFGGTSITVDEGDTRFPTPAEFNDAASSIRVPAGYCAILYEHANENGGYGSWVDLLEDCAD